MNFPLTSDRENVKKHMSAHSCPYCSKVFANHQALGGHLRAHQDEINLRRSVNYPGNSSNFLNNNIALSNCLMNTQPVNSSEVSGKRKSTILWGATAPQEFSQSSYSNENGWVDTSKLPENNAGNINSQFLLSPNFSPGSGSSEVHHPNNLFSATSAPSGITAPSFPLDPLFPLVCSGVCQFNTDQSRSFRDGLPSSGNILPNFQHQNPTRFPHPAYAIAVPDPSLGSNQLPGSSKQLPGFEESTGMVSLPYKSSILTPEGKRYSFAQMMTVPKRPKISCNLPMDVEKPQQKELLLLKDVENSSSGSGISNDAKEECDSDLDLSLHL